MLLQACMRAPQAFALQCAYAHHKTPRPARSARSARCYKLKSFKHTQRPQAVDERYMVLYAECATHSALLHTQTYCKNTHRPQTVDERYMALYAECTTAARDLANTNLVSSRTS